MKFILAILTLLISLSIAAQEGDQAAKIILLKGEIKAKFPSNSSIQTLKLNDWLPVGAIVQSAPKSFAKLLFVDKSQMNLGPDSKLTIESFDKKEPGVINLIKGELRAKVTKDYMEMEAKDKSKLFIKTKTAAMGVRGTDFKVTYTPQTQVTSLMTFEGSVAFAKIDIKERDLSSKNNLEKIVSSDTAVLVKKGEYSGAKPDEAKVSEPVKVDTTQLQKEKAKDDSAKVEEKSEAKVVRNIIPPGASVQEFEAPKEEIVKKEVVSDSSKKEGQDRAPASIGANPPPPPPPERGFKVDLTTGNAAPPPAYNGTIGMMPMGQMGPPPPTGPASMDQDRINAIKDDVLKNYNNAPPPPTTDSFGRVRFIFSTL